VSRWLDRTSLPDWLHRPPRWLELLFAVVAGIAVLAAAVPMFLDGPLRARVERDANRRLKGYRLHIARLHFHPLTLSLDLLDSTLIQETHPEPPVATVPFLSAGIHWGALLRGRLVAEFLFDRPALHVTLPQATSEIRSPVRLPQRGWQDALLAIYPLKVNHFRVQDAQITYVDQGPFKPLELTHVNVDAENIRNVFYPDRVYPSRLTAAGVVFGAGGFRLEGDANFLAKPFPGVKGRLALDRVELNYFLPITERYHLTMKQGVLSTAGEFEYAPAIKSATLEEIAIVGADLAYEHKPGPAAAKERQAGHAVVRSAKAVSNEPGIQLKVNRVSLQHSTFTYLNEAVRVPYQLFLSDADIELKNLSNHAGGQATLTIRGRFMGGGASQVIAAFEPEAKQLNLAVDLRIEDAEVTALNNLFMDYGNIQVSQGKFSLYSELHVKDGRIQGYVKPLFKDLKVAHHPRQPLLHRLYEDVMGAAAHILKNRRRNEVATVADLSGPVGSAQTSALQVIAGLVQNAFFKAILPGFERQAAIG